MGLIVQKFGGTSVGSPDRIRAVARLITRTRAQGHQLVIVVSAMGHTTDELIDLAHQISKNPPHREMDMLLTAGERISMALLSMALSEEGVPALSYTGSQSGIITDFSHRRARILRILGDRVKASVGRGHVAIVAGFQGVSESKEITTLGRGGSDTTAVALAASLGAQACEIYTDVDGVYSADPRTVPNARFWPIVPADLMVEFAVLGAGVLHPRSVQLARQHGVELWVKNSLNSDEGGPYPPGACTRIMDRNQISKSSPAKGLEEFTVLGVTADSEKALLTVQLTRPTVASSIWDSASEAHLSITAPLFSQGELHFYAERESEGEWKRILQKLSIEGFVNRFDWQDGVVPVSIVGDRFSQDGAALSEIFDVLSQEGVTVTHGAASALSVTVAVPKTHVKDVVRALHAHFLPEAGGKQENS